jgi:peptidoglycan/LPS O-acetylase OafA/YrhL
MKNVQSVNRLTYLDNLKVFLVMLVIVHHVGQAYGPSGGFWPYQSSLHESVSWLGHLFGVNAAFFMGLFFMISGYFFPGSFDRHGGLEFLKNKLIRYGIPLLFAVFIMSPIILYFYYVNYSGHEAVSYSDFFTKVYFGEEQWNLFLLHLWFVEHLLIYASLYFIFRSVFKNLKLSEDGKAPGFLLILAIGAMIAVGCFIIRIWYPIDKWVKILGFIQSEPAHLPQYAMMFVTGIVASRKLWFQKMDKKKGFIMLGLGLVMAGMIFLPHLPPAFVKLFFHNTAIYESFMAVFISWGLIVLFREFFNNTGAKMKRLAGDSYAAYIFHFPIVIAIQYAFDKVVIGGALGKFITVSILSIVLTYVFSDIIRKIPGVKKIL